MIIGISGYSGSGKDLAGTIIQEISLNKWEVKKWAGKLKTMASILTGIPVEKFEDQEFKKTELGPEWSSLKMRPGKRQDGIFPKKQDMQLVPMTVRDLLQKLGTDAIRDGLHTNAWVNAVMADYKIGPFFPEVTADKHAAYPNWIITDTRFPNEAEAIKKAGGIVIRINRPGVQPINPHPSETSLDNWNFDAVINNDSQIDDLIQKIRVVLYKHQIM
jgi:hypothetical protein